MKQDIQQDHVDLLNKHQANKNYHPWVCACNQVLKATKKGWRCNQCNYKQDIEPDDIKLIIDLYKGR